MNRSTSSLLTNELVLYLDYTVIRSYRIVSLESGILVEAHIVTDTLLLDEAHIDTGTLVELLRNTR